MSTLLDKSSQPVWVWVVVIVVGSIVILATTAWLLRYCLLRRRARSDAELISDEPAEKKLSLRRGRIVPATSYLSLTGSRFGLSSDSADDETQASSIRSKSPFEWWSNLRTRSARHSYVSHISSVHYGSSRNGSIYQHPDLSTSKLSLTSKDNNLKTAITEIKVARPQSTLMKPSLKRMSRNVEPVNFSRSFSPQAQRPAPNHRHALSRIEELPMRQSVFSTTSFRSRLDAHAHGEDGQSSEPMPSSKRASSISFTSVRPVLIHTRRTSSNTSNELQIQQPQQQQQQQQQDHNDQYQSPNLALPPNISSPDMSDSPLNVAFPMPPTFKELVPDPKSFSLPRQSMWDSQQMRQFPCLDEHNRHSEHERERNNEPNQPVDTSAFAHAMHAISIDALPQSPPSPPSPVFYAQVHDAHIQQEPDVEQIQTQAQNRQSHLPPVTNDTRIPISSLRTRSKKGNHVLRKKSLERGRLSGLIV